MLGFKVLSALSVAVAFVSAHPLNERLAARHFNTITSTTSATSSYRSLSSQLRTLRQTILTGQLSVTQASSQFQSFASQATSTFSAINGCSVCYGGRSASHLSRYAQQTYSELNSLIQTCSQVYGQRASSLLSYFSQFDSQCSQNLRLLSQGGVHIQSIVPPTFAQNMYQAGFSQTSNFARRFSRGSSWK